MAKLRRMCIVQYDARHLSGLRSRLTPQLQFASHLDVFPVHSPIMLNVGFIAAVSLLVLATSSSSRSAIELYWIRRTARPAVVSSEVQPRARRRYGGFILSHSCFRTCRRQKVSLHLHLRLGAGFEAELTVFDRPNALVGPCMGGSG